MLVMGVHMTEMLFLSEKLIGQNLDVDDRRVALLFLSLLFRYQTSNPGPHVFAASWFNTDNPSLCPIRPPEPTSLVGLGWQAWLLPEFIDIVDRRNSANTKK